MIQLQICMDIFLLGKACLSSQIIPSCPGMNCQGSTFFSLESKWVKRQEVFLWIRPSLILDFECPHLFPSLDLYKKMATCVRWPGFSYVWDYALSRNCKLLGADGQAQNEESSGATGATVCFFLATDLMMFRYRLFEVKLFAWFIRDSLVWWLKTNPQTNCSLNWFFPTEFNLWGCQILVVSNSIWNIFSGVRVVPSWTS